MKVKVGDKIFDANEEPIMMIFENQNEKETVIGHLSDMIPDARRYCMFPLGMDEDKVREFMKI